MKINDLENTIEAILFVLGEPVALSKIAISINQDEKTTEKIIRNLSFKYEQEKRGFKIIEVNNTFQMCSNPMYFEFISKICNTKQKNSLTQPMLETLSIIAYKQPVTKTQIEEIRGVRSSKPINKLMEYNLVCEQGRKESIGKPILFGTTNEFLKYFGFKSIKDLPKINYNFENLKKEAMDEIDKFV